MTTDKMKSVVGVGILLVVGLGLAYPTWGQDKPAAPGAQVVDGRPEILPEIDRLKSYAKDLKDAKDSLERMISDLKLYAQRLEQVIQNKDLEIQALKAPKKPN
jgi:hypothetical protein